ncbi:MAG TPA: phospholipase D-like domain-containing protein [Candidatus Methylomirabilis sp.]|nr:phospholipase D-like domain-containing protein [Candidatus Methylomirabilis sp.]
MNGRARGRQAAAAALILAALVSGCARVKPHVELPSLAVDKPSFVATLSAYSGFPVVPGNRVDILLNGDEIFPAKLEAVRNARRTINYAEYDFGDGPPAAAMAEALAERCRAGVKVKVLLDGVGSLALPDAYRDVMERAGCKIVMFRPLSPFSLNHVDYRNHRRMLVVDGRIAITGGSGMTDKWSGDGRIPDHWRDTDVRVEGPVVEQVQGAFLENWLEATQLALGGDEYFPQPLERQGSVDAQVVRSSPVGGSDAMYTMFLLALASAQRSILITNPYFLPGDKMIDTIVAAVGRGVKARLLIPGESDHTLVRRVSRGELGRLLRAGVEVYEYRAALLHAKTMVVDGVWATVGSANLDQRSFALNDELNLVIYNRNVARRLEGIFENDLSRSRRITYAEWNRRSFYTRLLELIGRPLRDEM